MITPLLLATRRTFDISRDNEGGLVATFAVAELDTRLASVECLLKPIPGRDVHEFAFSIVVASLDGSSETFMTQDRTMAAP